jgi:phosphoserine phosphatase
LGTSEKGELIETLKKRLKFAAKTNVFSSKGIVYDQDFKEYALHDVALVKQLHTSFLKHQNYNYDINPFPSTSSTMTSRVPRCRIKYERD